MLFCGDYAAQFDDLNGDSREICLTLFERGAAGWESTYSCDDVAYPAHMDDSAAYGMADGGRVWAAGRAKPHARLRVELYGGQWAVDVDADGWWLVVGDAPEEVLEAEMAEADHPWEFAGSGRVPSWPRPHLRVIVE